MWDRDKAKPTTFIHAGEDRKVGCKPLDTRIICYFCTSCEHGPPVIKLGFESRYSDTRPTLPYRDLGAYIPLPTAHTWVGDNRHLKFKLFKGKISITPIF